MAAAGLLAACSQDENLDQFAPTQEPAGLTIYAQAKGFEAADATRATAAGTATVFENGDQMGLYVIENPDAENAKVIIRNMALTYQDGQWTSDKTVYYYNNADYVAYFPYNASLSASIKPGEVEAKIKEATDAYLSANQTVQTQEVYAKADLMTARIKAADLAGVEGDTKALNFQFAHQYAMIEVAMPTYRFSYEVTGGTQEFSVSMIDVVINLGLGSEAAVAVSPFEVESGVYRLLLNAGTFSLEGSFYDPKDYRPVSFSNANGTKSLEAGHYVRYNVTYTGAPSATAEARSIIGDYYYRDKGTNKGVIWPKEFNLPSDKQVLGIIYDRVGDEMAGTSWNYYVMGIAARRLSSSQPWQGAALAEVEGLTGVTDFAGALADKAGFAHTAALRGNLSDADLLTNYAAAYMATVEYAAKQDNGIYTLPTQTPTSGYFLPSAGQVVAMYNVIGAPSTPLDASNVDKDNVAEEAAFARINEAIQHATGVANNFAESANVKTYATSTVIDLSTSPAENANMFVFSTKMNVRAHLQKKGRTSEKNLFVRPVFAF